MQPKKPGAKARLLNAAISIFREKGYTATPVDELCEKAGVTKGAFFHHFKTKDDLAVAAARQWSDNAVALFANAPYHTRKDPLDRLLAYIDMRKDMIDGPVSQFTCYAGTIVQEAYGTNPAIRAACDDAISVNAQALEADITEAMKAYGVKGTTAKSLALHTQAVLQGAFILAKAKGGPGVAIDSIAHLRRYIELLFNRPSTRRTRQ